MLKNDYRNFKPFYIYYKEQGVSHFFIYYNGIITKEIIEYFDYHDVTLIEWNFEYWNKHFKHGSSHVAQMGQMHHALYKYGKDLSEYMIFCDLDEYLYIPNYTLNDYIKIHPNCDVFGFCNRWSDISDNKIPDFLPSVINTAYKLKYKDRSKNIYKTSYVNLLNIHFPFKCNKDPVYITDLDMFHFFKWSGKKRSYLTNYVFVFNNKSQKISTRQTKDKEEDMEQLHLEVSSTFDEVLRVRELEARRRGEENRVWLREVQARAQDIAQELDQAKRMMEELRAASDRERASAEENKKVNSVM